MLTGDKLETAENIGKSCGLIKSDMTLMKMQQETLADCTKYMDEAIDIYKECVVNDRMKGFLIEGEALSRNYMNNIKSYFKFFRYYNGE